MQGQIIFANWKYPTDRQGSLFRDYLLAALHQRPRILNIIWHCICFKLIIHYKTSNISTTSSALTTYGSGSVSVSSLSPFFTLIILNFLTAKLRNFEVGGEGVKIKKNQGGDSTLWGYCEVQYIFW